MMKRLIVGGAALLGAMAALHRFGPKLGERAMKKCEEMFDHMPEECPPKRMLSGIETIREQNTQILDQLDELRGRLAAAAAG